MNLTTLSRRDLLRGGTATALAALVGAPSALFGLPPLERDEELVPFLDPQPINQKRPMVIWERLRSWLTPDEEVFAVSHYGTPEVDANAWRLSFQGLVEQPNSYSLEDLKKRPRREFVATLECSGNGVSPKFMGAIGNARWTGTLLAPLLRECGVKDGGIEVVFFGADEGTETIREAEYKQKFARSLSLKDAFSSEAILCYAMNDQPLTRAHGYPLRLVVPGWYGVAWVKWLERIEVHDRRFMNRFMGRDYVTIRGEPQDGETVWRETSVGKMNVKSIVARVTRRKNGGLRVAGAAWSYGSVDRVELSIDGGPWQPTTLQQGRNLPYTWTFWSYDWSNPSAGEHTIVSRAVDRLGRVQPTKDDPAIRLKKTYWEAHEQVTRRIRV